MLLIFGAQFLKWETEVFNIPLAMSDGTVINTSATNMDQITKLLELVKGKKAADLLQVQPWEIDG